MKKIITIIVVLAVISVKATIAGTITGTVISDSNGLPISGIWVYACDYTTGEYCGGDSTNSDGFYSISGLTAGTYKVGVSASGTQYASEYYDNQLNWNQATPVVVPAIEIVQNINFSLDGPGASISGVVKNSAGVGQANVWVDCWADNAYGTGTQTEANGFYKCGGLPVGYNYNVVANPLADSNYAITSISVGVYLPGEYTDNNIILGIGAILCGKVLDAQTAEPLAGVEIEYSNEGLNIGQNTFTDADGTFRLSQLPPGIAEVKAMPDVDSGYAWNLPWGSDWVCLDEGENRTGRIIALQKGALVRGHLKDAAGEPIGNAEYDYRGKNCEGWPDTDANGFYQMRLPAGVYSVTADQDNFGTLPLSVTITNVNEEVNLPDMICYTQETGGLISGDVNNIGEYAKTGNFIVIAFEAGTVFDNPDLWYTVQPIAVAEMENAGPFSLNRLPPDVNYDIYLGVDNQTADIESVSIQDMASGIEVGTTDVRLEYSSAGSTVSGNVMNTDGRGILGATVLLSDSSGGFRGFGDIDCNGEYVIHNVPAGTYTATAVHSKYLHNSTTVKVIDGIPADVNTIIMSFAGEKEGPDLNGDGVMDMLDVAEFSDTWLQSGLSEADFNQDNRVNFKDWVRMAENWQSKAIWYQE